MKLFWHIGVRSAWIAELNKDYAEKMWVDYCFQQDKDWIFVPKGLTADKSWLVEDLCRQIREYKYKLDRDWRVLPVDEYRIPTVDTEDGVLRYTKFGELISYNCHYTKHGYTVGSFKRAVAGTEYQISRETADYGVDAEYPWFGNKSRANTLEVTVAHTSFYMPFKEFLEQMLPLVAQDILDIKEDYGGTPPQFLCKDGADYVRFVSMLGRFTYFDDGRIIIDGVVENQVRRRNIPEVLTQSSLLPVLSVQHEDLLQLIHNQVELLHTQKRKTAKQQKLERMLVKQLFTRC